MAMRAPILTRRSRAAPDFIMAYLGKAWLLALANDPTLLPETRDLVETARRLPASEHEAGHLAALSQLVEGARAGQSPCSTGT